MDIHRIYTIGFDGDATLWRELHNASDEAALRAVMALLESQPVEMTWFLEVERGDTQAVNRWGPR